MALEDGMKYPRISVSPEQAQFSERGKFQINEIAHYPQASRLPLMFGEIFDTSRSGEQAATCQSKIVELTNQIKALIDANQRCPRDQDAYQSRYTELETTDHKMLAHKTRFEAVIVANTAKFTAVTTALSNLEEEPVTQFRPAQWSSLIHYAVVGEDSIRFVFRIGEEVTI